MVGRRATTYVHGVAKTHATGPNHRPEARAVSSARSSGHPPSVPGYRERPRLSALLDRGARGSDPPDAALRAAWLRQDRRRRGLARRHVGSRTPGCRSIRPTTISPASFATSSRRCRPVRAGAGEATDRPLRARDESESSTWSGATLLEEIAASDDPFVLVLDDYHAISAEPIHRLVRFLDRARAALRPPGPADPGGPAPAPRPPAGPRSARRAAGRRPALHRAEEAPAYLAEALPAELDPEQVATPPRAYRGLDRGPPAGGDLAARPGRCRRR